MKLKKKTAMAVSFAVGTMMFATTAFAEVSSKSGYDQLKDAAKFTAESMTEKLTNYTLDISVAVKDNGKILYSESSIEKFDVSNQATEHTTTSINGSDKRESYYYSDKHSNIYYNRDENTYYVTDYTNPVKTTRNFQNPFKEKEAADVEKIVDALVGNLKDYVVVSENSDGSKELSGSLNETQIPAVASAVVSFQLKNEIRNQDPSNPSPMPQITEDVFVKEVKGSANVDKDGMLQSILGTGEVSGKDEQGQEHILTFEVLGKISNINSTTVTKPDLSGKKVEKSVAKNYETLSNPLMYIGTYKSNLIIEKDGKLEKIGERIIDITSLDDKGVTGKYREEFKAGYKDYSTNAKNFEFSVNFDANRGSFHGQFDCTSTTNKNYKGDISIVPHSASLYFNINERQSGNFLNDGQFNRVFE